jgi:hypothetical protein
MDWTVVADDAEAIRDGATFPPVVVFYDGADHWLADGFHRLAAHVAASQEAIAADIREGTQRDAILYSVSANATHGLRRSTEDKQNAILVLLRDPEWSRWSDREMAKQCDVDHKTVGKLRIVTGEIPTERKFKTKHGSVATMSVGSKADEETVAGEIPSEAYRNALGDILAVMTSSVERHATQIRDIVPQASRTDLDVLRAAVRAAAKTWLRIEKELATASSIAWTGEAA